MQFEREKTRRREIKASIFAGDIFSSYTPSRGNVRFIPSAFLAVAELFPDRAFEMPEKAVECPKKLPLSRGTSGNFPRTE